MWVCWPHLVEAKVVGVSSSKTSHGQGGDTTAFAIQCKGIQQRYKDRYGVEVGNIDIVVHASPMMGRQYVYGGNKQRVTLEKTWAKVTQPYALQTIVRDIAVHDPSFKHYRY